MSCYERQIVIIDGNGHIALRGLRSGGEGGQT